MGVRTRRAKRHARTHAFGFGVLGVFGFIGLLALALTFSLGSLTAFWLKDLPDYKSADAYLAAEPTTVYDVKGNTIASFYLQNRRSITIDKVSPYVLTGTVATEDKRFYKHSGVDPQGILRAVFSNASGRSEGASTLTQQLVRNTILSDEQFDKTLRRKIREAYLAVEMEKIYTKEQILMMYLNTIYYGQGAYGIEAASITYFNKSAHDLTLAEAATLIGIPNAPTAYDPVKNPKNSKARRNVVLNRMLSAGLITQEEFDAASKEEIVLNRGKSVTDEKNSYPYFTSYVKTLLLKDFDSKTIYRGGLKVYTTLDPDKQKAAETAVQKQLDAIGNKDLESAMVAINNKNGYIDAMVGGRDYNQNQYNLATQAQRQPGSSFKTFTLVAALAAGLNPDTHLNCNSPIQVTPTWRVQNYGNRSYGHISVARATEVSSNTGYVQIAQAIGGGAISDAAKKLGIGVDIPSYASVTLGTIGVPVLQMAEGYSTIANNGVHRNAIAITKIEDRNDNVVYEHKQQTHQAIPSEVAYATTQVLEGVVSRGTATAVRQYAKGVNQPIAGKTGTTTNTRDLWFVGYTPQTTVAVWTGHRQEKPVRVWGSAGHPSNTSCPIFGRYLALTLGGAAREEFPTAPAPTYKPYSAWPFATHVAPSTPEPEQKAPEAPEAPAEQQQGGQGQQGTQGGQGGTTNTNNEGNSNNANGGEGAHSE